MIIEVEANNGAKYYLNGFNKEGEPLLVVRKENAQEYENTKIVIANLKAHFKQSTDNSFYVLNIREIII